MQFIIVGKSLKRFVQLIILPIDRCRVFLFRIKENVIFQNIMSRRALAKGGNHGWLPRWKRIAFSAKNIPLVRMSSISFISVMFAGVMVLYSILSLILLMRVMIFCVEMYFNCPVLYIRTETVFCCCDESWGWNDHWFEWVA